MSEEKNFASRVKALITELNISQAEFGRLIDKKPAFISDVISGRSLLSAESLTLIRNKLNVNPLWLLAGEGEMFVSEVELKRDQATDQAVELSRFVNRNPEIRELVLGLKAIPAKNQSRLVKLLIKVLSHSTKDLERLEGYLDGMGK